MIDAEGHFLEIAKAKAWAGSRTPMEPVGIPNYFSLGFNEGYEAATVTICRGGITCPSYGGKFGIRPHIHTDSGTFIASDDVKT